MNGNGHFGKWIEDEFGLPAYNYNCNQFLDPLANTPTTYGYSIDHFHQIGNDRITATVHNGGYVQVLASGRGFQWLTRHSEKKKKLGGGIAIFHYKNELFSDLCEQESIEKYRIERIFGMGYFKKKFFKDNLEITHAICAPFSNDPVLISEITVLNKSESEPIENLKLVDFWDIYINNLLLSLIVTENNRKVFGTTKLLNGAGKLIKWLQKFTKTDTEGARTKFDKKFKYNFEINSSFKTILLNPILKFNAPTTVTEPSKYDYFPKSLFLSAISENCNYYFINQNELIKDRKIIIPTWETHRFSKQDETIENVKNPCLAIGTEFSLKPKELKRFTFLFGYAEKEEINDLTLKYKKITQESTILKHNAELWKKSLIEFKCEKDSWLARETRWHSYYVRSAGCFDEYFKLHKFPQGSIYLFGHAFDGAIRDYTLFLNSVIFIDPRLAREFLTYILSLMSPEGKLPYAIYGFDKLFSRSVHSKPSDIYIFFIWAILQYIYTIRDFDFLNEKVSYYPLSLGKTSTGLERIYIALDYLFSEKVGFGEHDLIKCNDGDWSDGISLMVKSRKTFIQKGESNFNSAFALYLIPKLLPLLKQFNPTLADVCVEKLKNLKEAVLKSWNGHWFYRGWDGQGNPIGDKNIFLEHHNWLLISEALESKQALKIINEIYERLDKPSNIGQYISYPAQKVFLNLLPKGWDVNGGIWHAMNSLLTWGYSKYDSEKAYNSLIKNSMAKRAETYPNIWYGIWSGPDAYIANYAKNDGQAFYHLPTPMCDFPLMNLNLHACYLLSVIKLIGIEADYDSITIAPKIFGQSFEFNSSIISIKSEKTTFSITINQINTENLCLKIDKPKWWNTSSIIFLNSEDITKEKRIVSIEIYQIIVNIKENVKELKLILRGN